MKTRAQHRSKRVEGVQTWLQELGLMGQRVATRHDGRMVIRGRPVASFASADYLGLGRHPALARAVGLGAADWGMSLGMPRLLAGDRITAELEHRLAHLVGAEKAMVFPSTLHIAVDVIPLLVEPGGVVLLDQQAYPISIQGARFAAAGGATVVRFPHNDLEVLAEILDRYPVSVPKLIVVDGVYAAGGEIAELGRLSALAAEHGGRLYVDDAHGLGVLGSRPDPAMPFGRGGAGTPAFCGVRSRRLLHVASLAKALGVPVAFVAGAAPVIGMLRQRAPSQEHSSPPAIPLAAAALRSLELNAAEGEGLRRRLLRNVTAFRAGVGSALVDAGRPPRFPIQTLSFSGPEDALAIASALRRRGVWAALHVHPPDHPGGAVLRFLVTARHRRADIQRAVQALGPEEGGVRVAAS